jgi:hypothetical protein
MQAQRPACSVIDGFGGDGAHEVHIMTDQGEQVVWVKRDLWFDRDDDRNWVAWVQHRDWEHDGLANEDDDEAATLGSIVVTDPAVMAFIDQLGELLIDPTRCRHEPEFGEPQAQSTLQMTRTGPDSLQGSDRHPTRHGRPCDRDVDMAVPRTLMVVSNP